MKNEEMVNDGDKEKPVNDETQDKATEADSQKEVAAEENL